MKTYRVPRECSYKDNFNTSKPTKTTRESYTFTRKEANYTYTPGVRKI